jgi:hypothetical protein
VAFWKNLTAVLFSVIPAVVAIGIVVGGIVIMNIMLMAVSERTREIGIRKAVGARARDIERQFLAEAIALSMLGGIIGVVSGWAFARVGGDSVATAGAHLMVVRGAGSFPRRRSRGVVRRLPLAPCGTTRSHRGASGGMMRVISTDQLRENVGIAIDALRLSKLRLGADDSRCRHRRGDRDDDGDDREGNSRPDPQHDQPRRPDDLLCHEDRQHDAGESGPASAYIRIRPDLRAEEAQRIALLPQIEYAGIWSQVLARVNYANSRTRDVVVYGADDHYQEVIGG